MSATLPPVESLSEEQRDELLGRLVLDAFVRRGFGSIPVRMTDKSVALVVPRIDPAVVSSVPDLPPEFRVEINRRAATPEAALDWPEFRARLERDLRASAAD
jgi:hypothetical protein